MFKKIPLHLQIVIALILGTIFGIFFANNEKLLVIEYLKNGKTITKSVENWKNITFDFGDLENVNSEKINIKEFNSKSQNKIIKYFASLETEQKQKLRLSIITNSTAYQLAEVVAIKKKKTLPNYFAPIGTIFIRLLSFISIPLVLASLIVGAASLDDIKKIGKIGGRTFVFFMFTTLMAIIIGLGLANLVQPGNRFSGDAKSQLLSNVDNVSSKITAAKEMNIDLVDFVVNIIPKNPLSAMTSGDMLQIVFFAVMFGITLTMIDKKVAKPVIDFFDGMSQTMIKMIDIIMLIAPFGVFALISNTISDFGFDILQTLIWYCFVVVLGLFLHTVIVYGALVKFWGKMSPWVFFKAMRTAQAVGFSSSSSAATLPVTFDCVENKLGVKKDFSSFVLPLGATINMDGTALYQGVATIFIAQVYGMDLNFAQQITIVLTAVLASIGTAPVPGVGLIMLIMILQSVNVPAEGIALILGVDRILDMLRTITNVTGDAAVTVAIAGPEGRDDNFHHKAVFEG